VAGHVLEKCRIVAGLAVVENPYDETAAIAGVLPDQFEEREKELLVLAKRLMPRLPFDEVDLLIIDEIGKNISGAGMDTNIVGRKFHAHAAASKETPKVKRIFIRGLTEGTHGNASGIGLAEFCTTRAAQQVDMHITRINCLTAGHVPAAMIPMDFATDREAIEAALPTIGLTEPIDAKIVWIHNTLELGEVELSAAYLEAARQRSDLAITTPARPLPFDELGNLPLEGVPALGKRTHAMAAGG
jgi:hypothetical protein